MPAPESRVRTQNCRKIRPSQKSPRAPAWIFFYSPASVRGDERRLICIRCIEVETQPQRRWPASSRFTLVATARAAASVLLLASVLARCRLCYAREVRTEKIGDRGCFMKTVRVPESHAGDCLRPPSNWLCRDFSGERVDDPAHWHDRNSRANATVLRARRRAIGGISSILCGTCTATRTARKGGRGWPAAALLFGPGAWR